jgi:biotin transport system permease protein
MLKQCRNQFSNFIRNPAFAGRKMLAGFFISAMVIITDNPDILLLIFSIMMMVMYVSSISRTVTRRFFAVIGFTAIFTLFIHAHNNTLGQGVAVVLQMAIISCCSCLFITTTHEADILSVLEVFFNFLSKRGINTRKISLAVLLTIRSVVYITYQFNQIRDAQRTRNLEKNTIALLVPLLIKIFRAANNISDALTVRGYD